MPSVLRSPDKTAYKDYTGEASKYAMLGLQKDRRITRHSYRDPFKRAHATALVYRNHASLRAKELVYKPWPVWEDLELANSAAEAGLHVVKARGYLVDKKTLKFSCGNLEALSRK